MQKIVKVFTISIMFAVLLLAIEFRAKDLLQNTIEENNEKQKLVSFLKVYQAFDEHGLLKLARHGRDYDGGYVVPIKAMEKADVLMGYGIADDSSFEEKFSHIYGKPSYGFDCGITQVDSTTPLFQFVNQCIASDKTLYSGKTSSGNISSFSKQLDSLGLNNKKIFIKMDIEGSEYEAFTDILPHHHNITAIVLEIHFRGHDKTKQAVKLLSDLSRHFVLLHVHGNNCCIKTGLSTINSVGVIPDVIELTYINKNLVNKYIISPDQFHPTSLDMPNKKDGPEAIFNILDL